MKDPILKPETLQKAVATLQTCPVPQHELAEAMHNDVAALHNVVESDDPIANLEGQPTDFRRKAVESLARYSGLTARELRMYDNDVMPLVHYLEDKQSHPDLNLDSSVSSYLSGKHGVLSALAIPNIRNAKYQVRWTRSQAAGLQLVAALQLHRATKKSYPAKLEDLGLGQMPQNEVGDGFQYKLEKGVAHLAMPVNKDFASVLSLKEEDGKGFQRLPYKEGAIQLLP